MLRLALGTLRHHLGAFVGTFLAALLAVALLSGAGLLLFSVLTATPPADRFAATSMVVAGDREVRLETVKDGKKDKTKVKQERLTGAGTLPADLATRIASLDQVAAAVGDAAFPVTLTTADGVVVRGADDAPVIGHGWASAQLTPYLLRVGEMPGSGEVVLDADLAGRGGVSVGDEVMITSRTGYYPMRVAGIAAPEGRDALPAQAALFVADDQVAQVSGLAGPTAVGVLVEPGADTAAVQAAVRAAADGAPVFTGADRVRADLPGALPDYIGPISIFGFTIGITAFSAGFVLTSTVALGVRQRLRELALLRTAGATPGQLRRLLGAESVLLALFAALPGAPLGLLVAALIASRFRAIGAVPAQFEVRPHVLVLVAAGLAGALVSFAAARVAGRRAVRVAPTQALIESASAPGSTLVIRISLAVLTAGGAAAVLSFVPMGGPLGMGMSFVACALLLCAVAALGPVLVRPLVWLFGQLAGAGGVTGWLAGAVSRAEYRRVAAVSVPLVLMFAINATMLLNSSLMTKLTEADQAARDAVATAVVTAPAGMPLATVEELTALPGVTGAAATLPTRAIVEQGGKPKGHAAQGLLTVGDEEAIALAVTEGELGAEGTFGASSYLVGQYGWGLGDQVPMWLPDGTQVTLGLAAVYERARGFGDLVLPAELAAAHDPRGLAAAVALRYEGAVADQIADDWPAFQVTPTQLAAPAGDASNQQGAWELMMVISLGFTAIAVVNTFAIAAAGRRREYADLRLAGATVGQVRQAATREAAITVAVGLVLGAAVTAVVVGVFSVAQSGTFRLLVDPPTYAAMAAGVAALGLLAGAVPTRLVLSRRSLPAASGRS